MKRYAFTLALAALTACWASAQAPADTLTTENIRKDDGFMASLTFELATPSGSHGVWTTGTGAGAVVSYKKMLSSNFFIAPGLGGYYNTMGTDMIPGQARLCDGTIKNFGLRIPVMGGYQFNLTDNLKLEASTGPALNINVYAHESWVPRLSEAAPGMVPKDDVNLFDHGFRHIELMWCASIGLTYLNHYTVALQGGVGLTQAAKMAGANKTLNISRNNIAVALTYSF